jgi:hypothetical protein
MQATLSLGLLAGALGAGLLAARRRSMPVSMYALAACLTSLGLLPIGGAFVAMAAAGVAIAVANTALLTTFQRDVPPEVIGRVFGVVGAMSEGLRPLGLVLAGPLLALAGASGAVVVVGAGVATATTVWALPLTRCAGSPVPEEQPAVALAASGAARSAGRRRP